MAGEARLVTFDNVSKFYGEVLGVNRVNLTIEPGVGARRDPSSGDRARRQT